MILEEQTIIKGIKNFVCQNQTLRNILQAQLVQKFIYFGGPTNRQDKNVTSLPNLPFVKKIRKISVLLIKEEFLRKILLNLINIKNLFFHIFETS